MTKVPFPIFELYGPPCEAPNCKGVLVDSMDLKTRDYFQRCSVCKGQFNRMPMAEKVAWARRTIEAVLKGEKPS